MLGVREGGAGKFGPHAGWRGCVGVVCVMKGAADSYVRGWTWARWTGAHELGRTKRGERGADLGQRKRIRTRVLRFPAQCCFLACLLASFPRASVVDRLASFTHGTQSKHHMRMLLSSWKCFRRPTRLLAAMVPDAATACHEGSCRTASCGGGKSTTQCKSTRPIPSIQAFETHSPACRSRGTRSPRRARGRPPAACCPGTGPSRRRSWGRTSPAPAARSARGSEACPRGRL